MVVGEPARDFNMKAALQRRSLRALMLLQLGEQVLMDIAAENPEVETPEWTEAAQGLRECTMKWIKTLGADARIIFDS